MIKEGDIFWNNESFLNVATSDFKEALCGDIFEGTVYCMFDKYDLVCYPTQLTIHKYEIKMENDFLLNILFGGNNVN